MPRPMSPAMPEGERNVKWVEISVEKRRACNANLMRADRLDRSNDRILGIPIRSQSPIKYWFMQMERIR